MTSYDEIPYDSVPFPQSHPDRLATVATLFGLQPPAVAKARVLELGSAAGGNLIPVAAAFPDSRCVGIDLSPRQIADGQKLVDAVGLGNIELRAQSILDFDDPGPFDYIVCHGVYSWVPPEVQDRILAICAERLAPNGVAYVSYNTYPGWYVRRGLRQMMLYHTRAMKDPKAQVKQARALLTFLSHSAAAPEDSPYAKWLREELAQVEKAQDHYLLHEHLEDFNEPVFFYEFMERAAAKGLRYLGEAEIATMRPVDLKPDARETLQRLAPDRVRLEQYMDFLRNRRFRQTLLCRAGLEPRYQTDAEALERFSIVAGLSESTGDAGDAPLEVKAEGTTVKLGDPLVKAAFRCLMEARPRALAFPDLALQAQQRLQPGAAAPAGEERRKLANQLLHVHRSSLNVLNLHLNAPQVAPAVSERPTAAPLARHMARLGDGATNAYHVHVPLGPPARELLPHLDGTRGREDLAGILAKAIERGAVKPDPADTKDPGARVGKVLERLRNNALLVA